MEVNFGTSNVGKGKQPVPTPPVSQPKQIPKKSEPVPVEQKSEKVTTKVLTQKESSIPVAKKKPTPNPPKKKVEKKKPKVEPPPPKPKVADKTKSVLSNMLATKKVTKKLIGEGNDNEEGDKGKKEGNPYANSYYSKAGLGGKGKGYGLSGRNLQANGKVTQECNEEGTVVVRITVNQEGEVIEAEPGVRGSTNVHPCLLAPAKETAFLHKCHPDSNAPASQIGFVVINFKLSE